MLAGRAAIVFVAAAEGPEAAAAGSIGSSVLVGGREFANLWGERGGLAALNQPLERCSGVRFAR
jgi:hypothetical protein